MKYIKFTYLFTNHFSAHFHTGIYTECNLKPSKLHKIRFPSSTDRNTRYMYIFEAMINFKPLTERLAIATF